MTSELARPPRVTDPETGLVIGTEVGAAISADDAAEQLPLVRSAIRHLQRVEGYLSDLIGDDMKAKNQTERRAGDVVLELKPEVTWVVGDEGALFRVLVDACARNEITRAELDEACQQIVRFKFQQMRLSQLARRIPAINEHRRRVEGPAKLRQKQ